MVGGWYAPADQFDAVISPLLTTLPPPMTTNVTPVTYINSVQILGEPDQLNTLAPDQPDTFYAKSLMTPEASPMSTEAITAFMNYLSNEGFEEGTVR